MKKYLVGLSVVLLAACSSTDTGSSSNGLSANNGASSTSDRVCTYERPVGSKIKKKVCMSRAQKAKQQEMAQDLLRRGTVIHGEGQ